MFNNFKKPIIVSCLLATVAVGVFGSALAVGVAQAAPDFGQYFSINTKRFDPGQDLTAIRAKSEIPTAQFSDPAGLHLSKGILPSTIALQNAGEFTNVFPPVKALEMARFKEGGPQVASVTQQKPGYEDVSEFTAAYQPSVPAPMRSSLADISSETNPRKLLLIEVVSYQNSPAVKVQQTGMNSKSCKALDAKLDHMHLKPSAESARLAKAGCANSAKSI